MAPQIVPVFLKHALDLLEADPARAWTPGDCIGLPQGRRTLQRQFGHFVGQIPLEFLRRLRLDRARQALLRASGQEVLRTSLPTCGFNHVGRFASTIPGARWGDPVGDVTPEPKRVDGNATHR